MVSEAAARTAPVAKAAPAAGDKTEIATGSNPSSPIATSLKNSGALNNPVPGNTGIQSASPTARPAGKVERGGITIEPYKPSLTGFMDSAAEAELKSALEEELMPQNKGFVPPAAEEPAAAAVPANIPAMTELPSSGQNAPSPDAAELARNPQGPMSLLNRLRSSFGGKEENPVEHTPAVTEEKPAITQLNTLRKAEDTAQSTSSVRSSAEARIGDDPYAPKREKVDSMGRINPSAGGSQEEDQLEIPSVFAQASELKQAA